MANLEQRLSKSALQLQPQDIFLFNAKANKIPGVINMTVGEPNFSTPDHIKQAAEQAIASQPLRYTIPEGKPELTQVIADFLASKYQLHYQPESEIVTTIGVTEGVFTTLKSILEPGDEVLLPSPCFTIYEPDIRLNQGVPVIIDTSKTDFRLDPQVLQQTLAAHPQAKAIILNYPNNPTGVTYTREQLQPLVDILQQYDIFVISDEIYSELSYTTKHVSMAQLLPQQTILLNGLSKSHAMTGWRVGYICGPQKIMQHILHVHELVTTSISAPSQYAAQEALAHGLDDTLPMKADYQKRRDVLLQGLTQLGFKVTKPQGAFYMFAQIAPQLNQDDRQLAQELLAQEKLALLPGSFFGVGGAGYVRFSYAASMTAIEGALDRLRDYINKVS